MKIKENIFKHQVTTFIGFVVMLFATLDFFGAIQIPAPDGLSKTTQILIGFVVGLALFIMPDTWIKGMIEKVSNKKLNE